MDWRHDALSIIFEDMNREPDPGMCLCLGPPGVSFLMVRALSTDPNRDIQDSWKVLSGVCQAAMVSDASTSPRDPCENLERLIRVAHQKMPEGVSVYSWRRIYTDASILNALTSFSTTDSLGSIASLDRAIIIAGPAGEGRYELILSLIQNLQLEYTSQSSIGSRSLDERSLWRDEKASRKPGLATAALDIPTLGRPPSFSSFVKDCCHQPFILPGFAAEWPAVSQWHSMEYLRSIAGPGRLVPVEVGSDYRADDWSQKLMRWDHFLSSIHDENPSQILYLAQHDLLKQFPALQADIVIPDYVYSSPAAPADYPQYEPPTNEEQLVINTWLGPKGTISPAHTVCTQSDQ
jgi:hypothetical protein